MRFEFTGECSASQAQELKERLLKALSSGEPVECSFSGVESADMSFFELLHSARKSFAEKGVELSFAADLPGDYSRDAAWAGLPEIVAS